MRTPPRPATIHDYEVLAETTYYQRNEEARFADRKELIAELDPWSILEVGCGRGAFIEWAAKKTDAGRIIGMDPAVNRYWTDVEGVLRLLEREGVAFEAGAIMDATHPADLVCSFDVLEHLRPCEIAGALQHLSSLAKRWQIHTISTGSDVRKVHGQRVEMHLTQQPAEWWARQFQAASPSGKVSILPAAHRSGKRFTIFTENT